MIHQSPEELIEYNARLKAQRDACARLLHACEQGFLKLPVWTKSRFAASLRQQLSDCVL
ncbi:MAG: hypothetical protein ACK5TG_18635 [Planctomyces sp.]